LLELQRKKFGMKKETGIILAGSLGLIIGLGIFGLRRYFCQKQKEYQEYYSDFHRHFDHNKNEESNDGVEFFAMQ